MKSQREKLFHFAVTEPALVKFMLDERIFKLEEIPLLLEKVTEADRKELETEKIMRQE